MESRLVQGKAMVSEGKDSEPGGTHTHTDKNRHPLYRHLDLLAPEVPFLVQFMEHVAKDEDRSDGVTACCAGLLG